nr:aminomethyltransferase [uncultured bacterium]
MTLDAASAAARSSALVSVEEERGVLLVSGSERATWLNGVVTSDVTRALPGSAVFGLLLNKVGKIQTDFYVLDRDGALALALAPATEAPVHAELERMLVMEDAELESATAELVCVTLHGPRARELGDGVAQAQAGVTVAALDRTGLGGAVLLVPRSRLEAVVRSLGAAGAPAATAEERQRLFIERRLGSFGVDYGANDNPHEAGLDRAAVAWDKGCYLGQEVVFMQDARGKLKRRLVLLELESALPAPGSPILGAAGEPLGEVTSSTVSSVLERSLALGRVKAPNFEPGVRLSVMGVPATVRAEPV